MESVIGFGDSRVRQMSGTLSENSHSSVREVVYIKSDDQAKVAEERMVNTYFQGLQQHKDLNGKKYHFFKKPKLTKTKIAN